MLGLVRPFDGHAELVGLVLGELGQLDADLLQVQPGDFLVEFLGQAIDADLAGRAAGPEVELCQALDRKSTRLNSSH